MSAPSAPRPSSEGRSPASPVPASPVLGRVALGLGIATLVLALVAGIGWIVVAADDWLALAPALAVVLGLAAIATGIVAIVQRRGRRPAIVGVILAAAAGPLAWLEAVVVTVIMLASWDA